MTLLIRGGMEDADLATLEHHVWQAKVTGQIPDADAMNAVSAYWYACERDTPAKRWWATTPWHPAAYRALNIDPDQYGAAFAIAPFRISRIDGVVHVIAAYPAPRMTSPVDLDWLGITHIIAWNPITNRAHVIGDPGPQIVGKLTDDANTVFGDPKAFFQSWARARAMFQVECEGLTGKAWAKRPTERDLVPGALLIGAVEKVRWNPRALPPHITCVGINDRALNSAIFRAAALPRVTQMGASA